VTDTPVRPVRFRLVAVNVCEWTPHQPAQWKTDCGVLWELEDDTPPGELGLLYCPQCGGRLRARERLTGESG
jgi:hypothetical protein